MAIRNIIYEGDPLLREQTKTVTEFDDRLAMLLDDMLDTMRHENGCGLAAPQVGILKKVCIVCPDPETKYELINPVIVKESGKQFGFEGCLSVPNTRARVRRPKRIEVEYQDKTGERHTLKAEGYVATIFCHEIDHLNGILFTGRVED